MPDTLSEPRLTSSLEKLRPFEAFRHARAEIVRTDEMSMPVETVSTPKLLNS